MSLPKTLAYHPLIQGEPAWRAEITRAPRSNFTPPAYSCHHDPLEHVSLATPLHCQFSDATMWHRVGRFQNSIRTLCLL